MDTAHGEKSEEEDLPSGSEKTVELSLLAGV